MLGFQPLVVQAMAALVQNAEERIAEIILVIARGHAAIAGAQAGAERMHRHIQSSRFKIESNLRRRLAGQFLLKLRRIFSLQNFHRRLAAARGDLADQLHQRPAQRREHLRQILGRLIRLEWIEQGVVNMPLIPDALRFLLLQIKRLLQPRLKILVIRILSRPDPRLMRQHRRSRQFLYELRRHFRRPIVKPTRPANIHGRIGISLRRQLAPLDLAEHFANPRMGKPLMRHARQERGLIGPQLRALLGHKRLLIPGQQARGRIERGDLLQRPDQLLIAIVHIGHEAIGTSRLRAVQMTACRSVDAKD